MKSIVVYIIGFLTCFLLHSGALMAQKPAFDLISSNHRYRHPEVIMDTSYKVNPSVREAVLKPQPQVQDQKVTARSERKKRRQIGPSLDSLFHKEESKAPSREKAQMKISFLNKRINPINILIKITALK